MTDVSARENQVLDVNGDPCALIKIYTGLSNVEISGNRGVEKEELRTGVIWAWVPEGTTQLKLSVEGMPMLAYPLPMELERSTVYSLELKSDQLFPIVVNTGDVEADLWINDGKNQTNSTVPDLPPGEYPIRIEKLGYHTLYDTITVNSSNLYFTYALERTRQDILKINSKPKKAILLLDGEHVGYTDFSGYFFPGEYRLQISLKDYQTIDTTIVFDPDVQNIFEFELLRNTGWLETKIIPPGTQVIIDGEQSVQKVVELNARTAHNIQVAKPRYRIFSETFSIPRGDTLSMDIELEPQMGDLSFVSVPEDAGIKMVKKNITLNIDQSFRELEWKGSRQMYIPVGEYTLEASMKGYLEKDTTFVVADAKTIFLSMSLKTKRFNRTSAFFLSTLFPGLGQFYAQRGVASGFFLFAGLVGSAATGYTIYQAEELARSYTDAREAYKGETVVSLIDNKRTDMDDKWQSYQDAVQIRDICIGVTAGVWFLNMIDAVAFAKFHEAVPSGQIGNTTYRITPSAGFNSLGASLDVRF